MRTALRGFRVKVSTPTLCGDSKGIPATSVLVEGNAADDDVAPLGSSGDTASNPND